MIRRTTTPRAGGAETPPAGSGSRTRPERASTPTKPGSTSTERHQAGPRYRRPVPIDTELVVRARLASERGRRLHVDGELADGAELLAEARGAFLAVPLEHFLATPEGEAAAEAWRRRLAQ